MSDGPYLPPLDVESVMIFGNESGVGQRYWFRYGYNAPLHTGAVLLLARETLALLLDCEVT